MRRWSEKVIEELRDSQEQPGARGRARRRGPATTPSSLSSAPANGSPLSRRVVGANAADHRRVSADPRLRGEAPRAGKGRESASSDIVFPENYQEESLRGQTAHFSVGNSLELRAKVLPEAKRRIRAVRWGKFADMGRPSRPSCASSSRRTLSIGPATKFADKIHRVRDRATPTLEVPTSWVEAGSRTSCRMR